MAQLSTYQLDNICLQHKLKVKAICKGCTDEEYIQCIKDRLETIKKNKKILKGLMKLPKVEQKSEEWYRLRTNLITASDFAQALGHGKFGNPTEIIKKKCRPVDESGASKINPFFKWGNMFEPVANDVYSLLHHNVKIHEFGLLPHKKLSFFGASPDGITETGIMVEIKCPVRRKVEEGGEVPTQYYYQIQGQLEVCGLQECDYFECQFQEFGTQDEFFKSFNDEKIKGIMIEYKNTFDDTTYFRYSPIAYNNSCSIDEMRTWFDNNTNEEFVDITLWYLSHYNLQRVTLDKPFVDEKLKELKVVWDKILHYRQNPDKFDIEVLKIINIGETPRLKPIVEKKPRFEKKSFSGYSFIEDSNE